MLADHSWITGILRRVKGAHSLQSGAAGQPHLEPVQQGGSVAVNQFTCCQAEGTEDRGAVMAGGGLRAFSPAFCSPQTRQVHNSERVWWRRSSTGPEWWGSVIVWGSRPGPRCGRELSESWRPRLRLRFTDVPASDLSFPGWWQTPVSVVSLCVLATLPHHNRWTVRTSGRHHHHKGCA